MTINPPKIGREDKDWPKTFLDMSEQDLERAFTFAKQSYENLIEIQLQLAYHANISIRDSDAMTRYEYMSFLHALKKQKDAESEAMKKATESK